MTKQYKTVGEMLLEDAAKLDAKLVRLKKLERLLLEKHQDFISSNPELAVLIDPKCEG